MVLNELVTPGVLQPTPLKKNFVPRFEARTRKGENVVSFLKSGITQKITRLQILNHMEI